MPQRLSVTNLAASPGQVCDLFRLDFKRAEWSLEKEGSKSGMCYLTVRDGQDRQINVIVSHYPEAKDTLATVSIYGPGFNR